MLEITKFPHKHKCDAKRCLNLDTYAVGPVGEHNMFKQFYCKEHLLEIAERVNETFGTVSQQNDNANQAAELKAEIDELTIQLNEAKSGVEIEQIKAELASAKSTNELFREQIQTLQAENEKLKKANKAPTKQATKQAPKSSKRK